MKAIGICVLLACLASPVSGRSQQAVGTLTVTATVVARVSVTTPSVVERGEEDLALEGMKLECWGCEPAPQVALWDVVVPEANAPLLASVGNLEGLGLWFRHGRGSSQPRRKFVVVAVTF